MFTPNFPFTNTRASRRVFLGRAAQGVGKIALASLLSPSLLSAAFAAKPETKNKDKWTGVVNPLDYPAKAKRVIWLSMAGGPSHLETFDYKPKLAEMHGQPMPESFTAGKQIAQLQGAKLNCLAPQHPFERYGASGQQFAAVFPELGTVADEMCIIRSLHTEA